MNSTLKDPLSLVAR